MKVHTLLNVLVAEHVGVLPLTGAVRTGQTIAVDVTEMQRNVY